MWHSLWQFKKWNSFLNNKTNKLRVESRKPQQTTRSKDRKKCCNLYTQRKICKNKNKKRISRPPKKVKNLKKKKSSLKLFFSYLFNILEIFFSILHFLIYFNLIHVYIFFGYKNKGKSFRSFLLVYFPVETNSFFTMAYFTVRNIIIPFHFCLSNYSLATQHFLSLYL